MIHEFFGFLDSIGFDTTARLTGQGLHVDLRITPPPKVGQLDPTRLLGQAPPASKRRRNRRRKTAKPLP